MIVRSTIRLVQGLPRLFLCTLVAVLSMITSAAAQDKPLDAKVHIAAAQKAEVKKDWVLALREYRAAHRASATLESAEGIARSQYSQKLYADAYEAYDGLLKTYAKKLSRASRVAAEARLKELLALTGTLTITVSEEGANVVVDDDHVGVAPLASPVRRTSGKHRVKVEKEGYVSFEKEFEVPAGGNAPVDVKLAAKPKTIKVVVLEVTGRAADVFVDGKNQGSAPWQGDLPVGTHTVVLKGDSGSTTQSIEVSESGPREFSLSLAGAKSRLEIKTSDSKGSIVLDDKEVGQGEFTGDVLSGSHRLEVRREGYETFTKTLDLKPNHTHAETVSLRALAIREETKKEKEEASASGDDGLYGYVGLVGGLMPFGSGSELETNCSTLGAASCEDPSTLAGGLNTYIGYSWSPIGIEVMLGGLFDRTASSATFAGEGTGNPLSIGVPRTEDFSFLRAGGTAALRLRYTSPGRLIRGSVAAGAGASYKQMFLVREAASTDGRNLKDLYTQSGISYFSPALTFDAGLEFRFSATKSLAVGAFAWFETAGSDAISASDPSRRVAADGDPGVPIVTPSYHLARNGQIFIGPYVGIRFGP